MQVSDMNMAKSRTEVGLSIRMRRKELGLSQDDLAAQLSLSQQAVAKVEKGAIDISRWPWQRLEALRRALKWSPEEFTEKTGIELPGVSADQVLRDHALGVKSHIIPIVDAGAGLPSWTDTGEHIEVLLPEISGFDRNDLFAVRVKGDSMEPTLSEGDVVIFVKDGEPESGKIVAVHVPDDGLIVKRLQKVNGTWLLASDNPAHPPRPLREGERIFGVARAVVRRV